MNERIGELIPSSPSSDASLQTLACGDDGTEVAPEIGFDPVQAEQSGTATARPEEPLRALDHRIANILESITDGFFAVDRGWRFTYLNGRAEQIVGRKRDQVLGKRLWDEFPELAGSVFRQDLERATLLEGQRGLAAVVRDGVEVDVDGLQRGRAARAVRAVLAGRDLDQRLHAARHPQAETAHRPYSRRSRRTGPRLRRRAPPATSRAPGPWSSPWTTTWRAWRWAIAGSRRRT